MHKIIPTITGAAILSVSLISAPSPAQAATGGGCTTLTNGKFCIQDNPTGYRVYYQKTGGADVLLDFNLWCTSTKKFGDKGQFVASAGNTYSYVFAVGSQGKCQGVLRAGSGGSVITSTPYLTK